MRMFCSEHHPHGQGSSLTVVAKTCRYVGAAALKERSKESLERFRDVGERALTAGGIHLSDGAQLWNTYR